MSLGHGASIVRNGLVFYFDSANIQKSWKGAPVTNLAKNASNQVDWSVSNLTQTVSRSTITANEVYRITSTTGTGLTFRIGFTNATLVNGATYTVSYRYRIISGGPVFQARDWCDTAITTTTTALGGGIFYETATGTRATYDSTYRFLDFEISNNTVVEIWDLQLEERAFATPYSSTQIRTNTQALLDITRNSTVTTNSLTYTSNGAFSFNGTDNYLTISQPNVTLSPNQWSIEFILYPISSDFIAISPIYAGVDHFVRYEGANQRINFQVTELADVNNRARFSSVNTVPLNTFTHITLTINNLSMKIYINGRIDSTYTEIITIANWDGTWHIGQRANDTFRMNGNIPLLKIYNRELTATEIAQNFSAIRSRFNL